MIYAIHLQFAKSPRARRGAFLLLTIISCTPPPLPPDPCPHSYSFIAELVFEYDSATQDLFRRSLYICPWSEGAILPIVRHETQIRWSPEFDIALATYSEIEIYSDQIIIDSLIETTVFPEYRGHAELVEAEIRTCHQWSIHLNSPLESSCSFSTTFIFSVP